MGSPLRAALVALALAAPAQAEIVEADLAAPGDGLVTRDTGTGLDWLDLTETTGLSYDDILAGVGGWTDSGWRHATTVELCDLLPEIGLAPAPCPGSTGSVAGNQVAPHLGLLGTTNPGAGFQESLGVFDDGALPAVGLADLEHIDNIDQSEIAVTVNGLPGSSISSSIIGHFLVRTTPAVPALPGSAAALACALLAAAPWALSRACRRARRVRS